jgi:hypothetical protein
MRLGDLPAACALGALALLGCGGDRDPATQLCLRILERKLADFRVIEVTAKPQQDWSRIDYKTRERSGFIACEFEASDSGSLRARSVAVDGEPLTAAELVTINADLFLADLRRSDARAAGRGAGG